MSSGHVHVIEPQGAASCVVLEERVDHVLLHVVNLRKCPCMGEPRPAPQDLSLDGDNVASVLARVLSVDAMAFESYDAGRTVTKRIRLKDSASVSVTVPTHAGLDDYRASRPDTGVLIRPQLMSVPDTSFLYPYQIEGVDWLQSRSSAVLADDMGLGKTLQTITAIRHLVRQGDTSDGLVIAPKSLLGTWFREFQRWAPEIAVCRLSPDRKIRDGAWKLVLGRFHVYLTHYEHLRELSSPVDDHRFGLIVADEAHRTRRTEAQVTQSIRTLEADRWWALTGTPLERDARDFATLLSMVEPTRFAPSDEQLAPGTLRARARPYVLRRRKLDVLSQLPAVNEKIEWLELTEKQRIAYEAARQEARHNRQQPGEFLKVLNRLRQICDMDPASRDSSKIDRIIELASSLSVLGEKGVVFSSLLGPLDELERRLDRQNGPSYVRIDGSMSSEEREESLGGFRSDPSIVLLLASSRVASEGLTLTEANHGIFLNEWWNPSSNSQARDRIVRIGQTRPVMIYKFRCEGTVEEGFDKLLREKTELFNEMIEGLESQRELSGNTLRELADLV